MKYLPVKEIAALWNTSERSVRNYCAAGRVPGAFLTGKTWNIPENAEKPERSNKSKPAPQTLADILKEEKRSRIHGGIYHKVQVELTYNSNHMEGSRLTHEQTRFIFETNTVGITEEGVRVDDIIETANHFRCIDEVIEASKIAAQREIYQAPAFYPENRNKRRKERLVCLRRLQEAAEEVGGRETTLPEEVSAEMKRLLDEYNGKKTVTLEDILAFHVRFERIHPFQDGNGRVGRLIMFKECLKHNIVPFIIEDSIKMLYYRGLQEWDREKGYLTDTCLSTQDTFKKYLDYFRIPYEN